MSYSLNDPNTGTTFRVVGTNSAGNGAYLDQIVITKGHARYTSNYTPECLTSGTDALDAYVVMRLRFEGADGSTTITDDKGHSITNAGSNQIKTDQFVCGASAVKMTGGALTFPYSSDWNFGAGDFCIEARLRFHNIALTDYETDINLLGVYDETSPYGGYRFVLGADPDLEEVSLLGFVKHGVAVIISAAIAPLSQNTWYSFAVSRESGVFRLFLDGELIAEVDTSSSSFSLVEIGTVTNSQFDFALIP